MCAVSTRPALGPSTSSPSPMRSLSLHVSALNDDEYTLFTSSFADLVASDASLTTDDHFEKHTVSVREARAWLRGRYPDLPVADLDQVNISLFPRVPSSNYNDFRSYVCSPKVQVKTSTLPGGNFLPFFVLSCMSAVEQSWTETSFSNRVRALSSSSSHPALSLCEIIGEHTTLARH
jgi:hypothetical protein